MAKPIQPSSLAYWSEGKLKKKIQIYSKQEAFYETFTAEELSSSGDVYALGSVSASNNLAVGGNLHLSGTITLGEVSSAPSPGTDEGILYVKSDGKLYFKGQSNSSTEIELGAGTISALNNKAENRLVTIGSTTTELDGEANLTFDGSVLTVAGNVSASGDYYSLGSVSASNNLAVGGNAELSGNVKIGAGGSTTFSVDTNGNVSASGDYYALGSVSASNNLAVGGNAEFSGSLIAASLSASGDVGFSLK